MWKSGEDFFLYPNFEFECQEYIDSISVDIPKFNQNYKLLTKKI